MPEATLEQIKAVLEQLDTRDVVLRRELLAQLKAWQEHDLPAAGARLILEAAAREYPALPAYPPTPNEDLIRFLWSAKAVDPDDVAEVYPSLDTQGQASALRLLGEMENRRASETLARLLEQDGSASTVEKASWPVLLPLEREPRDADLLVPPLLSMCRTDTGIERLASVALAYATAGLLNSKAQHESALIFTPAANAVLAGVAAQRETVGPSVRWDEAYDGDVIQASVILDVLARLGRWAPMDVLRSASSHVEPEIALWGTVGLLRLGQNVGDVY